MEKIRIEACQTVPLDIPQGYYVALTMTTMAGFDITVVLREKETQTEYFRSTRQRINPDPPTHSSFVWNGGEAELYIEIPMSLRMDLRMDTMDINADDGTLLIRTITAVGEDSYDRDYNDLMINMAIMKIGG